MGEAGHRPELDVTHEHPGRICSVIFERSHEVVAHLLFAQGKGDEGKRITRVHPLHQAKATRHVVRHA
jgi:hypothetical protein